jgi:electron transfer flavoprotein-quinone oxidoreductase
MSEREEFDAIVVGAGPAGIAAAYTMAKAGLMVAVFERGQYPGAKNVSGGILFASVLNEMIPGFWEQAPVERPVTRRRFAALTAEDEVAVEIDVGAYERPPHNNSFTVLRARFDRWFAAEAEEAGAFVLPETVVDDLIVEGGKVVGVRARREEGEMYARVVILADGALSLLSKKAGLRGDFAPHHMISAVKEIVEFPDGVVADRFGLEENQTRSPWALDTRSTRSEGRKISPTT